MAKKIIIVIILIGIAVGAYIVLNKTKQPSEINPNDSPKTIPTPENANPYANLSIDELLKEMYASTDSGKTDWLVGQLKEKNPVKASEKISEKLLTSSGIDKVKLAGILAQFQTPQALNAFSQLLSEQDPGIVNMSANYIVTNGNEDSVQKILETCASAQNELIRKFLVQSIYRMKKEVSLKGLVKSLESTDDKVSFKANELLAAMTSQDFGFDKDKSSAIEKWKVFVNNK